MTAPAFNPVATGAVDGPDPVEQLHAAIQVWREQQDTIAARMLSQPDHTLDHVARRIRPALAPVVAMFDAQASGVEAQRQRTLTHAGADEQLAEIAADRRAAIEQIVKPAAEALAAAHAQTRAQLADVGDVATPEDDVDAAELADLISNYTVSAALPIVTKALREAAELGDIGYIVALRPLLQSLDERNPHNVALAGLLTLATAATATWQLTVSTARLARIERMQWELGELTTAALQGGRDGALALQRRGLELADADGLVASVEDGNTAARPRSSAYRAMQPPPRPLTRLHVTPEQRAADQQRAQRAAADDAEE